MNIPMYFRKDGVLAMIGAAVLILTAALLASHYHRSAVSAQSSTSEKVKIDGTYPSMTIIRLEGWSIPSLKTDLKVQPSSVDIDGNVVTKSALMTEDRLVDFESFYIDDRGVLKILTQKCRLRSLVSFGKGSRVFAYQAVFNLLSDTKQRESLGAIYMVYFVDYDGDGLFEQRLQTSKLPSLPNWVKSSN